jgi:hypothetical protein
MKKILFLLGILALASTNGCKKKDLTYVIRGKITDLSFNTPLTDAEVLITVTSTSSVAPIVKATLTTDANGYYEYELTRDKFQTVRISVSKANYFTDETTTTLDNLSLDKDNTFDYNLYAKSWVRVHFVSDGTKELKYYKLAGRNGCEECCPTGEMILDNVTDTSFYCINNGNTLYQVFYDVQGTNNNGTIDVISTSFQTTELLINY